MRRYWFIPLGILLAIAIACFFVGWVQLSLSPDTFGVIYTRAHGFEAAIVHPEGITWRWERLIPGALTLYRFHLTAQKAALPVSGSLPSAEVYGSLVPEKADFSFQLELSVLYRVNPESLPGLAQTTRLRPDGLGDLYKTLEDQMKARAMGLLVSPPSGEAELAPSAGQSSPQALASLIESGLPKDFPHVQFLALTAIVTRSPDLALYQRLRATYLQMAAAREAVQTATAAKLAAQEEQQKLQEQKNTQTIAMLEKFGQLLDAHPSLIKLLFLATSKNFSMQDLQTLDILDKLNSLE